MASRGFDPVRSHSEKMAYVNHCLRVINARPTISVKPKDTPKSPAPPQQRSLSFHARERERLVAAENERLLKKLTTIDTRKTLHPTTPSRSLSRSSSTRNTTSRSQSFSRLPSSMDRSSRSSSVSKMSKASSKPESWASSSAHVRKSISSAQSSTSSASSSSKTSESHTTTSSDSSSTTMSRDSLERKERE
ncbi:hypothetical protein PENTCL1PPCAC_30366 [Pristionchus entomophagus]|uniref:Cilia- and flagella-associated protein 97 n=1 Tax=Pristionchus entomophagus TaxID=358040 RepID=A0AAV5TXM8_9BILA|nr:hypothetical protein PENTCL1PPCAC_21465 [Pristionchus entomophagus]GMT08192.1 hypothetical protein PENTCL1PPCAC_30366 [Pristionchus entomophagus]